MDTRVWMLAIAAGLFFGTWPFLMNRSGLNGYQSAAIFAGVAFLAVIPAALFFKNTGNLQAIHWDLAIFAGILGGAGLLCFNSMLSRAAPSEIGRMIIVMIILQTVVPAVYHVVTTGRATLKFAAGLVMAIAAVKLLSEK